MAKNVITSVFATVVLVTAVGLVACAGSALESTRAVSAIGQEASKLEAHSFVGAKSHASALQRFDLGVAA